MVMYGFQFIKTPYGYGGDNFSRFDCSGFVQELLHCVNLDPIGDQNAQGLYDFFKTRWEVKVEKGSLLFFGKSLTTISHVAIALGNINYSMLESGGGDQWTRTDDDAKKANAFVRIRPIARRHDFLVGLYPKDL